MGDKVPKAYGIDFRKQEWKILGSVSSFLDYIKNEKAKKEQNSAMHFAGEMHL
jgi:hypothetical protein